MEVGIKFYRGGQSLEVTNVRGSGPVQQERWTCWCPLNLSMSLPLL